MLRVKTELRPSSIHGLGCFTLEKIKKGALVWKFDQGFDLRFFWSDVSSEHPVDFLNDKSWESLKYPSLRFMCCDYAQYMNHSSEPNCDDAGDLFCFALRDIEAGEELTCDYATFAADFKGY